MSRGGGIHPWIVYGGLGAYLLVPVALMWIGYAFESLQFATSAVVLVAIFLLAGDVFFRVVVTLPILLTILVLRRRDLTWRERLVPALVNVAASALWWIHLLGA